MDVKMTIAAAALFFLLIMLIRYKKSVMIPLAIAFIASAIWTAIYRYEYIGNNLFLFNRINIFPLVLWTCGLTGLYIIQTHILKRHRFMFGILVYLFFLFALEAVGYHLLHVRLATNYPSLWNSGVIHGSILLKLFYIIAGPMYLLLLRTLQKFPSAK